MVAPLWQGRSPPTVSDRQGSTGITDAPMSRDKRIPTTPPAGWPQDEESQ
ncbi:conserved domain protein [Actinomyces sp. oral taxon 170 str. F0386]|nr:conserved domain protein [Actinomyces sp. oral taxon 170 str. F0386]